MGTRRRECSTGPRLGVPAMRIQGGDLTLGQAPSRTAALAASPSPRPMKPNRSVVVALMLMSWTETRRSAARLSAIAARGLAMGGAPISRITVRKVLTDIAHPERAQHGVAQCVDHDITVGMRDDPLRVVDFYATQDDVVARAEGVYIEPLADSHVVPLRAPQYGLRHDQIRHRGHLDVERRSAHQSCGQTEPLHRLRLIGHRQSQGCRIFEGL